MEAQRQEERDDFFAPIEAKTLRLHVTATNGAETARVYEVRVMGRTSPPAPLLGREGSVD